MNETLFYSKNFYLMRTIYYFKRGQSLKYQKFNKCNRKSSGGSCPQFVKLRFVPIKLWSTLIGTQTVAEPENISGVGQQN